MKAFLNTMAEKQISLWKRIVGYAAFTLFALVATFFLSFPYDVLKDRVRMEADSAGYFVRIDRLGPGFFSVKAKEVEVSKKTTGDVTPEPLRIDSVSISPSVFPPGIRIKLDALGGTAVARLSGMGTTRIKVDLEDIDLSQGNVKGFSGIDFAGRIEGHLDLSIPRGSAGPDAANAPTSAEPDLSQASGTISLQTKELAINGGTANITIAQFGPDPTPVDLPKIVLGELTGKIKIDKGAAAVEEFKSKSSDLEINVTGTLKMAKRFSYAEPSMEVHIKPDPEFQKRLGLLGSALSMIGSDPKDPSWRMGRLTGYLGRPQFR